MKPPKDSVYYQSKFEYYRNMCYTCAMVSGISSVAYIATDVLAMKDNFQYMCLIPRFLPLLFLVLYVIVTRKVNRYSVVIPLSYGMIHIVMLCTCWALYYRAERTHANEGFLIMNIIFLALGLCSSYGQAAMFHSIFLLEIIVTNVFNHYETFSLMLIMNIPCIIAVYIIVREMDDVYYDTYCTKLELERITKHDNLTGAFNRNVLADICDSKKKALTLNYSEIALIMIDVDFFKKINDTYGHESGDNVLKNLSAILQRSIDKEDYMIRWGGEEFIVILCGKTEEQAKEKAEEIRKVVEADRSTECQITISLGGTMYKKDDFQSTIASADVAMYQAKNSGRNRVVFQS